MGHECSRKHLNKMFFSIQNKTFNNRRPFRQQLLRNFRYHTSERVQQFFIFWQFKLHGTAVALTDAKVDRSERRHFTVAERFETRLLADPLKPLLFKGFNGIYANVGKLLREQ